MRLGVTQKGSAYLKTPAPTPPPGLGAQKPLMQVPSDMLGHMMSDMTCIHPPTISTAHCVC